MENNKKFSLNNILANEKALAVISFLLAFLVWISIAINEAPEVERVVEDVKVTIDDSVPAQLGYDVFGVGDVYVDVTVKGKRYMVGDNVLSADDIKVVAVTTHVDAPGIYSLQLKATPKNADAQFEIVSKSMDNIEVYFDTPKTAEFLIDKQLDMPESGFTASDEYMAGEPFLSSEKITITGPETEINKIQSVIATASTKGNLRETETLETTLMIADAYGAEIKYLTYSGDDITITIPIYKTTELPTTVDLVNVPASYLESPKEISISPAKLKLAVDTNKLDTLKEISVGTIDWTTLKVGQNTITLDVSGIKDGIPLDKNQKFSITINVPEG